MDTFRKLVFTAVIAGLLTGGLVTLAHFFGTASIIARAEVHERSVAGVGQGTPLAAADPTPPNATVHAGHGATAWEPGDGAERTLYTLLANVLTATAFSLLLATAMELRGGGADWRTGLFWGLAGFATFTLAPGLGLPPELPGNAAASVPTRQLWWASTTAATAGGLALLFFQRRPVWAILGVALLVAPHLYGAPQPAEYLHIAPERLERDFIVIATTTSLLFWAVLGTLTGLLLAARTRTPARAAGVSSFNFGSR